jgi:hypothetical protein
MKSSDLFTAEVVRVLSSFSDGRPQDVGGDTPLGIETVKWLFLNGYLQGIDSSTMYRNSYLKLTITPLGLEHLEQLRKQDVAPNSRDRTYQAKYPIRAAIVVVVAGGLLLAAIGAMFSWLVSHGGL